jgi:hypothetical protein
MPAKNAGLGSFVVKKVVGAARKAGIAAESIPTSAARRFA